MKQSHVSCQKYSSLLYSILNDAMVYIYEIAALSSVACNDVFILSHLTGGLDESSPYKINQCGFNELNPYAAIRWA